MSRLNSPVGFLIISGLCFAVVHSCVKALPRIPIFEILLFRALISASLTYLVLRRLQRSRGLSPFGNSKRLLIARGMAGTCALLAYFYTLQELPLATAVTIQYLHPILTVILAGWFFNERATPAQWLCFAASFVGVIWVRLGSGTPELTPALFVGVLSALCSALAYSSIRASKGREHPLVVVFYLPLVSIPVALPFALLNWVWPTAAEWGLILVVGLLTQLAQYFMTLAYQQDKAANISNLNYLGIIYGVLIGAVVFGESVTVHEVMAMFLIAASAIASSRLARGSQPQADA